MISKLLGNKNANKEEQKKELNDAVVVMKCSTGYQVNQKGIPG